jgi:hypothetical protein
MKSFFLLFLFTAFLSTVCPAQNAGDEEVMTQTPLLAPSAGVDGPLFEKIPSSQSGVDVQYEFDPEHPLRRLYPYGWAAGNVAIGDLDGDGKADLFFPGTTGPHRLFLQREDFRFEEVTEVAQLGGADEWASCAVLGDVENDGDLDIYIVNYDSPNRLLMNISRGGVVRFTDMADDHRVDRRTGALSAAFVDADNDGNLDLYLQTYHIEPEGGRPDKVITEVENGQIRVEEKWRDSYIGYLDNEGNPQWVESPLPDQFLRNNGKGQFFPHPNSNLGQRGSYSTSQTWWDFDHNLSPDLYLANDSHMPDLNLRNVGDGSFVGTGNIVLPATPWWSRGGAAADFDNDLLVDFFATGSHLSSHAERLAYGEPFRQDIHRVGLTGGAMQVTRNTLFQNTGSIRFRELARMAGVAQTGTSWATLAGDYDGDGLTDCFVTTGSIRDWTSLPSGRLAGQALAGKTRWDTLANQPERRERDVAFQNRGDWNFRDVSKAWGVDHLGMSYSAGQGDLDGDGDLDLVVCPLGEEVILYRNRSQANRVVIALRGEKTNRFGVGAEIIARVGDRKLLGQMYPTGGYKQSNDPVCVFGLGASEKIDRLTVRWPSSGALTTLTDLQAGNRYEIREAFSIAPAVVRDLPTRPIFLGSNLLESAGYQEPPFDDYIVQPLIPRGVSRTGPSLAASDLDSDGVSELFFGGTKDVPARLVAQSGKFLGTTDRIEQHASRVDGAVIFFDANNDGNPDLFSASGAVETSGEESRDRLYLGGSAGFQPVAFPKDAESNPPINSGPVAACDFDRDGNVDLFVGSRFAVGRYPESGSSRLYRNDGTGAFENVTEQSAAGLSQAGAVTSAIWTDVDADGWRDLLVTTHWGPIRLWKNKEGKLFEATAEAGLAERTGLWNGIFGGDVDNDGDIDYVVTNEGLNSFRKAPAEMFFGDFLGIGKPHLIETVTEKSVRFPRLGWLDLAELQPKILEDYPSPGAFASSGIPKLFSEEAFSGATRFEANTLEASWLENDGKGVFTFHALPRIAQASTSYGVVLTDINADGRCDIWMIQNRSSANLRQPDPEATSVSQLFMNTGRKADPFLPLSPEASGLLVYGPGRGVIATDLNKDDRVDLVASIQNHAPAAFLNRFTPTKTRPLKVRVEGKGKHPAGARVTVNVDGMETQTAEYYAGGGYLSQSPTVLFFAASGAEKTKAVVHIEWADGTRTKRTVYSD